MEGVITLQMVGFKSELLFVIVHHRTGSFSSFMKWKMVEANLKMEQCTIGMQKTREKYFSYAANLTKTIRNNVENSGSNS